MFRAYGLSMVVVLLLMGALAAQDSSQIHFVFSDASLQEPQPQPTLPAVEVRPPESLGLPAVSNIDPIGSSSGFAAGQGISWSSGVINSDRQLVGPYRQPVWTTQRPWTTTRVYVLPPGQMQLEQWFRPTYPRGGKPKFRFLEEYAVGLPGRFQLDLYERWNVEPNDQGNQVANHEGVQLELRWAMADWGQLPLNPTLYAEWVEKGGPQDKPNVYELKLLLGDEIARNCYFASNIVLEQETGGEREQELAWSNALSTTIIDRFLLAGIESNFTSTTVHDARGEPEFGLTIGPSIQLRPTNRVFLDIASLFGVTNDSPDAQMYAILGYQFGTRAGPSVRGPLSTIGN